MGKQLNVFEWAGRELLCRSVWSERSGVSSEDRAVSRCRLGEEMTSCRSFSADGLHAGETVGVSLTSLGNQTKNPPQPVVPRLRVLCVYR